MGTRGFISFVVDGETKTAYNHHDSYPDGLGVTVLDWLRMAHEGGARRMASALRVVEPNSHPTDEDIERLAPYASTHVGAQRMDDWYVLLRGTQGNPAAILDAGVIEDASNFPADSLFAEYGYVVDFDARMFEAYEGFQKSPHDKGRFADLAGIDDSPGYYPVALVASWSFDSLPTDDEFVKSVGGDDE
jgi:hypothetical protein